MLALAAYHVKLNSLKFLAVMKHYNKMLEIMQFLRKTLSLYFDFLLNELQVQNGKAYVVIDFLFFFLLLPTAFRRTAKVLLWNTFHSLPSKRETKIELVSFDRLKKVP